jgi:hypothetical protein
VVAFPFAKSEALAMEEYRQTPGGLKMFTAGLEQDFADMQRETARSNASLVEKSKRPKAEPVDNSDTAVDEPDDDPDGELAKLGELYRRGHPAAKFSREAAIAYAAEHDERGRELLAQSKRKQMSKLYGEKYAEVFKLGSDMNAPRPKPFRVSPPTLHRPCALMQRTASSSTPGNLASTPVTKRVGTSMSRSSDA